MTYIPHLAVKLKVLRMLRDMHQLELSEKTGIRRNLLIDYERGRAIPGPKQLVAIESALGIKFNSSTEAAFLTLAPGLEVISER